jgi:CRISPR/Cas system type I-B associated protein Csh2 (Cas7 group RAMP superfamily)
VGTIKIERSDETYVAEYFVDQGLITVYGERGQESTQIGGLSERQVAILLLNSLIRKGQIDPVDPSTDQQ